MRLSSERNLFISSGKETDYFMLLLKKIPFLSSLFLSHSRALFAALLFVLLSLFALLLRFFSHQPLALGEHIYRQAGFIKLLLPLGSLFSSTYLTLAPFVGILLGTTTFYLLALLFEQLYLDKNIQTLSLTGLLLAPSLLYSFITLHPGAILLFLFITSFYFLLHPPLFWGGYNITHLVIYLSLLFAILLNSVAVLLFLIFLLIYWRNGKYLAKHADLLKLFIMHGFLFLFLSGILFFLFQGGAYLDRLFFAQGLLQSDSIYYHFLADFGGLLGFSLFFILIAIIGFLKLWGKKQNYLSFFYISGIILASYFFLDETYGVFLTLVLALLAAVGFNVLIHQSWKLGLIRDFCLLLLVLGCIFTATAFLFRYPHLEPQADFISSLTLLTQKYHAQHDELLLTHSKYVPYLSAITDFPTFTDPSLIQPIFSSRRLDTLFPLLDKYNIRYLLITPEMRSGLVWNETTQLLFLLENSEKFKKKIETSHVDIWLYKGSR